MENYGNPDYGSCSLEAVAHLGLGRKVKTSAMLNLETVHVIMYNLKFDKLKKPSPLVPCVKTRKHIPVATSS
jgi:hypothetical protein